MARPISIIELTAEEDKELRRRVRAHSTPKRDSLRAAIVLRRAGGMRQKDAAKELGVSVVAVNKWSQRFERKELAGLADKPGRGRKPSIPLHTVERVITEATRPPKPRARWSTRSMASAVGISADSVRRIWRANDLRPHVLETFKLSSDPCFEEKFWDVIGLYLDPPERALNLLLRRKEPMPSPGAQPVGASPFAGVCSNADTRLHPAWNDHTVHRAQLP